MVYFLGGVVAWVLVPLVVALLVVMFRRFRSRERFIKISQYLLWGLFLLDVLGSYALSIKGYAFDIDNLGPLFLQVVLASVVLFLISYFDKAFLWLKREVV